MTYINIQNLSYRISGKDGHKKTLFENMNMALNKGEITCLTGDNGVGKTTLSRLIIGSVKPDYGRILIDSKPVSDYKSYEIGRKIGYLFQNPELQLFNESVYEELLFPYIYGQGISEAIEAMYDQVILDLSLEDIVSTPVHALSRGEKQRLAIGTLLMMEPDYMILDEPTVGLNQELIEDLQRIVNILVKKGIGFLIISHNQKFIKELKCKTFRMTKGGHTYELEP